MYVLRKFDLKEQETWVMNVRLIELNHYPRRNSKTGRFDERDVSSRCIRCYEKVRSSEDGDRKVLTDICLPSFSMFVVFVVHDGVENKRQCK